MSCLYVVSRSVFFPFREFKFRYDIQQRLFIHIFYKTGITQKTNMLK